MKHLIKFLILIVGILVVSTLTSCEGKVTERVNQLIDEGNFAEAYDVIDKEHRNFDTSKLNDKILNSEIVYLIGDEDLSAELKATKILLTVQERAKYSISHFRSDSAKDMKEAFKQEKNMLQKAATIAYTNKQEEVASLLQEAINKMEEPEDPSFLDKIFD